MAAQKTVHTQWEARFIGIEEAEAHELTALLGAAVRGAEDAGLNLEGLEAIVVSDDYEAALRSVRDTEGNEGDPRHTNEEFALGVAMAIPVRRPEGYRSTVVVRADLARGMRGGTEAGMQLAISTIAHELAHVDDHGVRALAFGPYEAEFPYEAAERSLWAWSDRLWTEYRACWLSAGLDPDGVRYHAEMLTERIAPALAAVCQATKDYRISGDLLLLLDRVERQYGFLLKASAYVHGLLRGLGKPLSQVSQSAADAIEASPFRDTYARLGAALEEAAATYPGWSHPSALRPVMDALCAAFDAVGLENRNVAGQDGRMVRHVGVPLRPETTPSADEEAAIRAALFQAAREQA